MSQLGLRVVGVALALAFVFHVETDRHRVEGGVAEHDAVFAHLIMCYKASIVLVSWAAIGVIGDIACGLKDADIGGMHRLRALLRSC